MAKKRKSRKEPTWQQLSLQMAKHFAKQAREQHIAGIERRAKLFAALASGKPIRLKPDCGLDWPTKYKAVSPPSG